jgi:hypothetical protein
MEGILILGRHTTVVRPPGNFGDRAMVSVLPIDADESAARRAHNRPDIPSLREKWGRFAEAQGT